MSAYTRLLQVFARRLPGVSGFNLNSNELVQLIEYVGNSNEPGSSPINSSGSSSALRKDLQLQVQLAFAESNSVLSSEEWNLVLKLVDQVKREEDALQERLKGIEEQFQQSNVLQLVDKKTASQLVLKYGSIENLALVQSDQLLSNKSPLYLDPWIVSIPQQFRKQAMKMLAGKVILAARMDVHAENSVEIDTGPGKQWKREIEDRIAKLMAPPPSYKQKPLPKPIVKSLNKRGGKRIKKAKEKQKLSSASLEQNIMKFGVPSKLQ